MLKKSQKYLQIALFAHLTLIINSAVADEANWRIVNYWSEWCAPCRIEIPMFNALFNDLKASNVSIVGIYFDEDPRDITLDIAKELGVEFPTLTIEEVEELALRPPDVMPTTYLLSPTNEVVAKLVGMQSREDILNQLAALGIAVQIN